MADFHLWRRRVYAAAKIAKKGIMNSRFDTSDAAQEAVLQILAECDSTQRSDRNINDTYLQKVGNGTAKRLMRFNLAQKRCLNREHHGLEMANVCDPQKNPEQFILERDSIVQLINCINKLPYQSRLVVCRRFFDRMSFAKIAEELDTSFDVVHRKYEKAIRSLKALLGAAD